MSQQITDFTIMFFNQWIFLLQKIWPFVGVIFGISVFSIWLLRDSKFMRFAICVAYFSFLFEPGLYLILPYASKSLTGNAVNLEGFHIWSFCIGTALGIAAMFLMMRYLTPKLDWLSFSVTKKSSTERNKKTDVRQIQKHLPDSQKMYVPTDYFNAKHGIFVGLDEKKKAVYIELDKWRRSHIDVIGTTGSGKGVSAAVMLAQAIISGESVIVFDPKNDEFLPHVLHQAACECKVPYVFIDLTVDLPQWNPLQNKTVDEIEELFSAGFSLGEKGTDADFYRLDDRRAARLSAKLAQPTDSISTLLRKIILGQPELCEKAKKFISDLDEICSISATNIVKGIDVESLLKRGSVIYIRGSMRNPKILKLQRMLVLSMIQFIEARERANARHVCLFFDEFKYLISRQSLEALGAIRDKKAHVMLAHQSLGDLRDCPADLNSESVVASVNENCSIKIAYAVKDPDTADWLSRMSGSILVDDEIRQVKTNVGLSEIRESGRSLRQSERNLIDVNMLQSLPERCAVIYGLGLARFVFTSPIPINKRAAAVTPIQFEVDSKNLDELGKSEPLQEPKKTIAQALLDV